MTNVVARLVAINFYEPQKGLPKDFTKWPPYKSLENSVHQSVNKAIAYELKKNWVASQRFVSLDEQQHSETAMREAMKNVFKSMYQTRKNNAMRKGRKLKLPFGSNAVEFQALQAMMKITTVDQNPSSSGLLYYSAYMHIYMSVYNYTCIWVYIYKLIHSELSSLNNL